VRKIVVVLAATCGVVKEITKDNGTYLLRRAKAYVAATSGLKAAKTISIPETSSNPFLSLKGFMESLIPLSPALYEQEPATPESIETTLNNFSYFVDPLPWALYLFSRNMKDEDIRNQARIVMTGYGVTGFKNVQDLMNNPPLEALQNAAIQADVRVWAAHCKHLRVTDQQLTIMRLEGNDHLQALAPRKIPDLYSLACKDKKRDGQANYTITYGLSCKTLSLQREKWLELPRAIAKGSSGGSMAIDGLLDSLGLEAPPTKKRRGMWQKTVYLIQP
jgi:hypothetical protein